MESRSQPHRDALLAFKLLAHHRRFVQWHSEAKAGMWTHIALACWAIAIVVDVIRFAHPEEDDTRFAVCVYTIIIAIYNFDFDVMEVVIYSVGNTQIIRMATDGSNLDDVFVFMEETNKIWRETSAQRGSTNAA